MSDLILKFTEQISMFAMILAWVHDVKEPLGLREKSAVILSFFLHLHLVLIGLACAPVPLRHMRAKLLFFVE